MKFILQPSSFILSALCLCAFIADAFSQTVGQWVIQRKKNSGNGYEVMSATPVVGQFAKVAPDGSLTFGAAGAGDWDDLTGTPTTLDGYGITDAAGLASNSFTGVQTLNASLIANLDQTQSPYGPAVHIKGPWKILSGSVKPMLLIEPVNVTASSTWATTGTALGINSNGSFSGNFLDFQSGGTSVFKVSYNGTITGLGTNITSLPATSLTGTIAAARMPALTGDVTTSSGSVATTLASSGVTAGTYNHALLAIDSKGRITSATNGTAGGGTWGSITGTLSGQSDLQTALDAKAAKSANLSDLASASTARTNLGLAIGTNVQAYASELSLVSVRGSDIASAGTLNLDAATGDLVDVTGTTTITAVTLSSGRQRLVRFTGSLTLTHSSGLVLPGAANINTVAGDYAVFVGNPSSIVRVLYFRADGTPVTKQATATVMGSNNVWTYYNAASNSDAARGSALEAAKAAATSGQTIYVHPGTCLVTSSIAKNGVNWHLRTGSKIRRENVDNQQGIFDDGSTAEPPVAASAMSYSVTGDGKIEYYNTFAPNKEDSVCGAIAVRHASSLVTVGCESIATSTDNNSSDPEGEDPPIDPEDQPTVMAAFVSAGQLYLKTARTTTECRGWSYGWTNGVMHVESTYTYGDDYGLWGDVDATPTGDFFYRGNLLETGHSEPVYHVSSQDSSVMWVEALDIKSALKSNVCHGGKTYITAQKIWGGIVCAPNNGTNTEVYVTAQKMQAVSAGGENSDTELVCIRENIPGGNGILHMNVLYYDLAGQEKATSTASFKLEHGEVKFNGGTIVGYYDASDPMDPSHIWRIGGGCVVDFAGVTFDGSGSTRPTLETGGTGSAATIRATGCKFLGADTFDVYFDFGGVDSSTVFHEAGNLGNGASGAVRMGP